MADVDLDELGELSECDCDPRDPCGYCDTTEPYWGKSRKADCGCQACSLRMPDLCDNDPKNWDTEDQL